VVSDFGLLGIEPTTDPAAIKAAYRRKAKEIHPDINRSGFDSHLRFIALQQAYHRLLAGLHQAGPRLARPPATAPSPRAAASMPAQPITSGPSLDIKPAADPAYAFYRAGMNEYMKVHPSVWSKTTRIIVVAHDQEDMETLRETQAQVRKLTRAFPKAYYYFSMVVNEYPASAWALDARDKLVMIEQQTIRYKSIIESFIKHAKPAPRVNRSR
jgi:hypothetical protein